MIQLDSWDFPKRILFKKVLEGRYMWHNVHNVVVYDKFVIVNI